ncbi:heat-inducible transcriptional repressor HrcA [Kineosporia rhizophila]|uniref:heat-inducible transcriptional repressor HrcA n=1 Tax=Kineosporia TaxID=49184 RepID=UPI001E583F0E|nr:MULTISPECIES: heat-inducible transcriptional repressor HrcA [Kineosporia]MCE0539155.1 heat-inducible transcriptional repressor HrcA [Kineosporia rhizophila]GLY18082.1 heat-inducible transcription repressor HrcA [Kineosporia sp. NBRC 101677]
MSEERKLAVLRAIVEDYVETREPVGSRALVERHSLGVSPATIRNDMAALEDEGYIAQPHTSAGRVPTDKGYRMFVDRLSGVKPLSQAEKRAIQTLLDGAVDLDDVVTRTTRLLAQLTRQVAVVQYPSLSRSTVRHVELVALEGNRLLVILITNTGRVEQRMVPQAGEVSEATLSSLRSRLNQAVAGRRLTEVSDLVAALPEMFAPDETALVRAVIEALEDSLDIEREERIVLAGTANLARSGTDFVQTIGPVLEAIEEHVVLLKLLTEMADGAGGVGVLIGRETAHIGLMEASVVSSGYASQGEVVARLGVLGPTRMDYPNTMAAVRAVARYVSRILAS